MTYRERYDAYVRLVEDFLREDLSDRRCPGQEKLADAMRYSALAGGKRLRPILTLEFCRVSGGSAEDALPFAAALELIHTYSLIHDDLPCMDDDDLRRGRPTSHRVYGEAVAVLAGDALLTRAFELVSDPNRMGNLPAARVLSAVHALACEAGVMGMVGGQMLDLEGEIAPPDAEGLVRLQSLKTGALMRAAARMGCLVGGADEAQLRGAKAYASALGLAFQIRDDMLDVEGDQAVLGKAVGADAARGKATLPALTGMDACRERVRALTRGAVDALAPFGDQSFLTDLALELAQREK